MKKSKKLYSESVKLGKYRVRIYEPRPGANLSRSIYLGRKENRKTLGHRDRQRAREDIQTLLEQLNREREALERGHITLGMLARLYLKSEAHRSKTTRTREDDRRIVERVADGVGASKLVAALDNEDVRQYMNRRREGDPTLLHTRAAKPIPAEEGVSENGSEPAPAVGDRTIQADLNMLRTIIRWGMARKDASARRLVREDPLPDMVRFEEKNPKRPVLPHEHHEQLLAVAGQVSPLLPLALVLADAYGRRLSAIRQLCWCDILLDTGQIVWRASTDKNGFRSVLPMPSHVQAAIEERRQAEGPASEWVFPAPSDPRRSCSRHLFDSWLRQAFELAGLPLPDGGLWHCYRRKWATERKEYPTGLIAAAGGWTRTETVEKYIQAAEQEAHHVLLNPTSRIPTR